MPIQDLKRNHSFNLKSTNLPYKGVAESSVDLRFFQTK